MDIARVIGSVVATQKDPALQGVSILLVQPLNEDLEPAGKPLVATDAMGIRGPGEIVFIVTSGDAVYTAPDGRALPVDAAIMGIVDDVYYQKSHLSRISKKGGGAR